MDFNIESMRIEIYVGKAHPLLLQEDKFKS